MMKQGQCLFTFRCVILVYSVRYSTSVQTAALEIPSASLLSSSGSKFSKCKVQECNMALGSWLDTAGATTVAIWYCAVMDIVWRGKEVVLVHAMNSCGGSGGIAPFTLNLGTRWGWVFSITALLISLARKSLGSHWIGGWVSHIDKPDTLMRKKSSWWTKWQWDGFSPSMSIFPSQFHSTNAPYSFVLLSLPL